MSKHTPGPWWTDAKYREDEGGCPIIAANTDCGQPPGNPTRGMVAWAHGPLQEDAPRCEANARLIAAAPDLLEALEMFLRAGVGNSTDFNAQGNAVAAAYASISKARGVSP